MAVINVALINADKIKMYREHISVFFLSIIFVGPYTGISTSLIAFAISSVLFAILTYLTLNKQFLSVIKEEIKKLLLSSYFILPTLTLISFAISTFTGIRPDMALYKWLDVLFISLGGVIWYYNLRNLKPMFLDLLPRYLFISVILISLLFLIDSLVWKTTGFSIHSERFFLSVRKTGAVFAILAPFIFLYALKENRFSTWLGVFLCTLTVFFCGGRSGIISYSVILVLFPYFFPWGQIKNWGANLLKYVSINALAILTGICGYYLMAGKQEFIQRVASERAATGSGRTDIWQFTWDNFLHSPIFGIGPQNFRYLNFEGIKISSTSHPHNIILELLLETGVVGTFLLAAFVISLFIKTLLPAHRTIMTDSVNIRIYITATFLAFVAYFINAQFLTSFFHGWWLTYPTILAALLAASYNIYSKAEKQAYQISQSSEFPVKVSVVMPCHNGETFIAEAIESVINQTEKDWELLIVNDGSTDNSQSIINNYVAKDKRIKSFVHPTALGAGAARNTGMQNASGRFTAFLDCDDLWKTNKLSQQLFHMQQSGAALSTTHYDVINDNGIKIGTVTPNDKIFTFGRLLKCNDIGCSAAIIDNSLIKNVNFPNYQKAQDFVFWCDILRQGYLCLCIHENLGSYRVHKKSRTLNKIETAKNRITLLYKAIGVPFVIIPYYIAFYILYGVLKQLRSGETLPILGRDSHVQ